MNARPSIHSLYSLSLGRIFNVGIIEFVPFSFVAERVSDATPTRSTMKWANEAWTRVVYGYGGNRNFLVEKRWRLNCRRTNSLKKNNWNLQSRFVEGAAYEYKDRVVVKWAKNHGTKLDDVIEWFGSGSLTANYGLKLLITNSWKQISYS